MIKGLVNIADAKSATKKCEIFQKSFSSYQQNGTKVPRAFTKGIKDKGNTINWVQVGLTQEPVLWPTNGKDML